MEHLAACNFKRAVELEKEMKYDESLKSYQCGLQILLDIMKGTTDTVKYKKFHTMASQYMEKAEEVKKLKETQQRQEQLKLPRKLIRIKDGEIHYGYNSLFGQYLNATVTHIHIEDPYIRTFHQCQNLVRLCELAVQKCSSLSKISLVTTCDPEDSNSQSLKLEELKESLKSHLISFEIIYSETLHDRQIVLSNGWIIKIGRGLDYFKPCKGKFTLGYCDLDLRPCQETTVDIFHKDHLQGNNS